MNYYLRPTELECAQGARVSKKLGMGYVMECHVTIRIFQLFLIRQSFVYIRESCSVNSILDKNDNFAAIFKTKMTFKCQAFLLFLSAWLTSFCPSLFRGLMILLSSKK